MRRISQIYGISLSTNPRAIIKEILPRIQAATHTSSVSYFLLLFTFINIIGHPEHL